MQPPLSPPDTAARIAALVDRLAELDTEIKAREAERKKILKEIETYALTQEAEPLANNAREGRQVIVSGVKRQARVLFESDLMIASFQDGSATHQLLLNVLGDDADELKQFFDPPDKWTSRHKDGLAFRQLAQQRLSSKVAPLFVAACRQVGKGGVPKSRASTAVV